MSGHRLLPWTLAALTILGTAAPVATDSSSAFAERIAAKSRALTLRYAYPVPGGTNGSTHAGYPAADIFKACGATVVSPVDGVVSRVDRVDDWNAATDNPWARGGKSVAIKGRDRVRHYLAHFSRIKSELRAGDDVVAGERLGRMGRTGRAGACHTHYGISRMCPVPEWWVRRGVVAPQRYLTAWREGQMLSPYLAVRSWAQGYRGECSSPSVIGAS
ncbi:MAG: M23 family metallopeptidase [Actinomycetota bacterium]|jgi:murein DD-endopeptidase MepM/ murein hydrolase activator NlpD|nr:M23 family metallopeptidase [Actinomycetota bacterium]